MRTEPGGVFSLSLIQTLHANFKHLADRVEMAEEEIQETKLAVPHTQLEGADHRILLRDMKTWTTRGVGTTFVSGASQNQRALKTCKSAYKPYSSTSWVSPLPNTSR